MHTQYRPWGWFQVHEKAGDYCLKTLSVMPGKRTSLQSHVFRTEVWVVLSGVGLITLNGDEFQVLPQQVLRVEPKVVHRLSNMASTPLIINETWYGPRLSEEDIIRYEDDYGRVLEEKAQGRAECDLGCFPCSNYFPPL